MIRAIGTAARRSSSASSDEPVHLDLSVRVRRHWRGDERPAGPARDRLTPDWIADLVQADLLGGGRRNFALLTDHLGYADETLPDPGGRLSEAALKPDLSRSRDLSLTVPVFVCRSAPAGCTGGTGHT